MSEIINEIIVNLMRIIIAGVFSIAAYYIRTSLVPWLKDRAIYDKVCYAVRAAEKLAASGQINKDSKKNYVLGVLARAGIKNSVQLNAMIEAAVEELDCFVGEISDIIGEE